jgi:hypothetical protein
MIERGRASRDHLLVVSCRNRARNRAIAAKIFRRTIVHLAAVQDSDNNTPNVPIRDKHLRHNRDDCLALLGLELRQDH